MTTHIALGIEYDGTHYHGWQRQTHANSVQQQVEQALTKVADSPIEVACAGRTDSGVHATQQVIHFTTPVQRCARAWTLGMNSYLPPDIAVIWSQPVNASFHARFSAVSRRYVYLIYNADQRPALFQQRVSWYYPHLDTEKMQIAAMALLGEHDFSSFRAAGCQSRSPMRQVEHIQVTRHGALIAIDIQANAFLHHMVRNIVGALLPIGWGKQPPEWLGQVLQQRDRRCAGITAKPEGLYLIHVVYPEAVGLALQPRFPLLFAAT